MIEENDIHRKRKESIDLGDLSLEQRDILIFRCVNYRQAYGQEKEK